MNRICKISLIVNYFQLSIGFKIYSENYDKVDQVKEHFEKNPNEAEYERPNRPVEPKNLSAWNDK